EVGPGLGEVEHAADDVPVGELLHPGPAVRQPPQPVQPALAHGRPHRRPAARADRAHPRPGHAYTRLPRPQPGPPPPHLDPPDPHAATPPPPTPARPAGPPPPPPGARNPAAPRAAPSGLATIRPMLTTWPA